MKSRNFQKLAGLLAAIALLGGSLFAASADVNSGPSLSWSETLNVPVEASQLLKKIQSNANKLSRDAATLESYGRGGLSRQSHASQLMEVKSGINAIGDSLERLQAIRHATTPWQQRAIDSIVPVAANLADHTEAAIVHLNENPSHLWTPVYTDRLKLIDDRAGEIKESVDLHLELAATQDKLEALRTKVVTTGS